MKLRLVPATLFGRLLAALLAVVGAMLLVVVMLVVRERSDLLFRGSETSVLVAALADTSRTLAALSGEERAAELARLRTDGVTLSNASASSRAPPPSPSDTPAALRSVQSRLARELGTGFNVAVAVWPARFDAETIRVRFTGSRFESFDGAGGPRRSGGGGPTPNEPGAGSAGFRPERGDGQRFEEPRSGGGGDRPSGSGGRFPGGPGFGPGPRGIEVAVTLPDASEVLFRADVPRSPPPLPRQIFFELAALTLVLGVVLYLMARNITKPLSDLAHAAEAAGRGERRHALQETGARELRDATRAFNTMQERLYRYLDSRTRVLAAMSHDLRTPLTRLKLRVEAIDDDKLRERFIADLDEMNAMVTGALNLFRGLNDDEPPRAVDVGALLDELRVEFAELGATVTVEHGALAPIAAKPHALKRCLTNLVSNAVKYGKTAVLSAAVEGGDLVIRVRDEGLGIPEDELERVFEPFFRLESSRNSDTGGTGLGLSIARDVAQAHGGSLALRNVVPHGLEAILRLPQVAPSRLDARRLS